MDNTGTLIFSDLAGAFEGAVDMVADTRARNAGSLCEASIIVLTDRQEVDAADVADMQAAVSAHSGAEVVDPDAAAASGQHVFVVHFVDEEVPEDPVLDALSCIGSGVGLQVRKRGAGSTLQATLANTNMLLLTPPPSHTALYPPPAPLTLARAAGLTIRRHLPGAVQHFRLLRERAQQRSSGGKVDAAVRRRVGHRSHDHG